MTRPWQSRTQDGSVVVTWDIKQYIRLTIMRVTLLSERNNFTVSKQLNYHLNNVLLRIKILYITLQCKRTDIGYKKIKNELATA